MDILPDILHEFSTCDVADALTKLGINCLLPDILPRTAKTTKIIAVNAVWGGLMGTRARCLGVKGVVVEGRIRDLGELEDMGFPAFSTGTSALGAKPFVQLKSISEPIVLAEKYGYPVTINPGDVIMADIDGVVCCPIDKLVQVIEMCQISAIVDAKCMKDIKDGASIKETFAKHRGK